MMKASEALKALEEGKALALNNNKKTKIFIKIEYGRILWKDQKDNKLLYVTNDLTFSDKDITNGVDCSIYNEHLIDEVEKRYLSEIITPFKKQGFKITVGKYFMPACDDKECINSSNDDKECINIHLSNDNEDINLTLPCFKIGKMYKRMEKGREYTQDELELYMVEASIPNKDDYVTCDKGILSEAEKRFLSRIIKPFKKEYKIILKKNSSLDDTDEAFISICFRNDYCKTTLDFPRFTSNNRYKGMKKDRDYTPEDLGL